MENDNLENLSKKSPEKERVVAPEQDFSRAFGEGDVPPFKGSFGGEKSGDVSEKQFGIANPSNDYYGETVAGDANSVKNNLVNDVTDNPVDYSSDIASDDSEYNTDIANAAALINYGIGAASEAAGSMEALAQKIKGFDASGSDDPIGDFFRYLGVDTPAEAKSVQEKNIAASIDESDFRSGANAPSMHRSIEGAVKAINDMKELIGEVEGADSRYAEIRAAANAAGMGCFDYIAKVVLGGEKNLMGVLNYLSQQHEASNQEPEPSSVESETPNQESEASIQEPDPSLTEPDLSMMEQSPESPETAPIDSRETLNPDIIQR